MDKDKKRSARQTALPLRQAPHLHRSAQAARCRTCKFSRLFLPLFSPAVSVSATVSVLSRTCIKNDSILSMMKLDFVSVLGHLIFGTLKR